MEQWSILSTMMAYFQYNGNHVDYYWLVITAAKTIYHNKTYNKFEEDVRKITKDYDDTQEKLKREYDGVHKGVNQIFLQQSIFTTKLLDGAECQILLNTGDS